MTGSSDTAGGPLRPRVAVAFATVGFAALAICGLGVTSLAQDAEVISLPGAGYLPGVAAMTLALAAFGGALAWGLRAQHPSYGNAAIVALAAYLAYALGIVIGAIFVGAGPAAAIAAAGGWMVSWFGVVVAGAALVSAWAGIALVRTRSARPRWSWERDEEE